MHFKACTRNRANHHLDMVLSKNLKFFLLFFLVSMTEPRVLFTILEKAHTFSNSPRTSLQPSVMHCNKDSNDDL